LTVSFLAIKTVNMGKEDISEGKLKAVEKENKNFEEATMEIVEAIEEIIEAKDSSSSSDNNASEEITMVNILLSEYYDGCQVYKTNVWPFVFDSTLF
jgi:hypothetical protein